MTRPSDHDAAKQLTALDANLRNLKDAWEEAPVDKKEKWMARINEALDARLVLMRARDLSPTP